jgi:hypothetical protein
VKPRGFGAPLSALPALALITGCAAILGLPNVEDAANDLCVCPIPNNLYPKGCTATLRSRLDAASPADRQAWLEGFVLDGCDHCERSAECFLRPPTCVGLGQACMSTGECCDNPKGRECREGTCQ